MKRIGLFLFTITTILASCKPEAKKDPADIVFTNGKVYTVNEAQQWAEAVAIKDGRIVFVGSTEDAQSYVGEGTETVDIMGKMMMPGIHDTHIHTSLVYSYQEAGELLFSESLSKEEIAVVLKKYLEDNPDIVVMRGQKWSSTLFPGGKATKEWLDAIESERPVYLIDDTGHNAVVNSKALEMAGITKATPDPEFGVIDRDPKTGEPTGYLSETAMGLVAKHVVRPSEEAFYNGISKALDEVRAYGTTSITEMLVGENALKAYKRLDEEGKLNVRVRAAIAFNDYAVDQLTNEEAYDLLERTDEFTSTHLNSKNLKYWADGSPVSGTSILVEPYLADSTNYGKMTIGQKQFDHIIEAHKNGVQIHAHSIGDGTTRIMLDLIEKARKEAPQENLRHHLGHMMLVHPDDIPRFKELDVVAEFSPMLWYPNGLTEIATEIVGEDRMARWQPIKEFVDTGVTVSFGSDWPAGTPDADPWRGIQAMLTRMDPTGATPGKIGEGITLEQALEIVTVGGAKLMMQEDEVGTIEKGKFADMIILDQNLFEINPDKIADTKVLKTIFEGKVVYEKK